LVQRANIFPTPSPRHSGACYCTITSECTAGVTRCGCGWCRRRVLDLSPIIPNRVTTASAKTPLTFDDEIYPTSPRIANSDDLVQPGYQHFKRNRLGVPVCCSSCHTIAYNFVGNSVIGHLPLLKEHDSSRSVHMQTCGHLVFLAGPERQSSMQPHTDLDKIRLILWRDDPMSDEEVNQDSSRVRLELFT
jgi:hypothetical protein